MPRTTHMTDNERRKYYGYYIANNAHNLAPFEINSFFNLANSRIRPSAPPYHPGGFAVPQNNHYPSARSDSHFSASTPVATEAYPVHNSDSYTYDQPHHIHHHHDSGIPWWALCLSRGNNTTINNYNGATPSSDRRNNNVRNNEDETPNFAAFAGVLIAVAVVTGPAIIGAFYLTSELWNNLERLYYNEGYLMAGFGMINIIASLSLSAVLINTVLSSAITALAISAGFANPISWAFFIMGCVTLFTASCLHLAIQEGMYRTTALCNQHALHPEEPGRFTITDKQVDDIKRKDKHEMKHLNRDKIQNVITAIHHDLIDNPSTMARVLRYSPFFRSTETAERLGAIRKLRTTGTVDYTTVVEDDHENNYTLKFDSGMLFSK